MKIKLVFCWIFAFFLITSISPAENFDNITATNTSAFSSNSENILILVCVILLVAMMLVPVLYDIQRAYALEHQRLNMYYSNKDEGSLPPASRIELCKIYKSELKGIDGLSRGLFASGIIIILGIILFYGIIKYGFNQYISNIASILGGTLSTIVGFYFGAKSTSDTTGSPNQTPTQQMSVPSDEKKKDGGFQ